MCGSATDMGRLLHEPHFLRMSEQKNSWEEGVRAEGLVSFRSYKKCRLGEWPWGAFFYAQTVGRIMIDGGYTAW